MSARDGILIRIAAIAPITEQDLEDMRACDEIQLAALMRGYENDGKVGDRSAWTTIATIIGEIAEFAPLAGSIIKIATTVATL